MSAAAMYAKSTWYADGLRWIGSLLHGAADHLERNATASTPLEPRVYREIEDYVSEVRNRAHIHI